MEQESSELDSPQSELLVYSIEDITSVARGLIDKSSPIKHKSSAFYSSLEDCIKHKQAFEGHKQAL